MEDSKKKSILKTISWRIIAIITSMIVAYIFTKSFIVSIGLVLTANIISMIIYYFHERIWNNIKL